MGRVTSANQTYGGMRVQIITRYYASTNPNPGTTQAASIGINRLTLTWGGLSISELTALQNGFDAASTDYVLLECVGIGHSYNNVADRAMVTVDPASPTLAVETMQGYAEGESIPLVHDAQATFLVQTFYE